MLKISFFLLITCLLLERGKVYAKNDVIILTEENWKNCLEGEWMIKFFAPWCPACQANEADYKRFSQWSDELNINVAVVDITKQPGLSGRFMVTALPTFYHGLNGEFRRYAGKREAADLHHYFDADVYHGVESIYWLRHPNSIPMTLMSWLFKTSIIMKNTHELLTETYGLSSWMSYTVFGVATLVTGLTLGLILVCIVDCISPPKSMPASSVQGSQKDTPVSGKGRDQKEDDSMTKNDEEEGEAPLEDEPSQETRRSSQASSHGSQDWATLQDPEIPGPEIAAGKGVRKRHLGRYQQEGGKEAGDAPGEKLNVEGE